MFRVVFVYNEYIVKSTASHDYITKLAVYQKFKVKEYNIVEQNGKIIQYSYVDDQYVINDVYKNDDIYVSSIFKDFQMKLSDIFSEI
ncbi:Uma2 family endonuclease [Clostridium butyricum]|uniref:Uma2 family endonuclease n=1 Tax=Clostridium butyricum TaxID=1492 RepID=UPI002103B328|nr:Uma2 family endonuclease [Clostridium butyricum]MCQ2027555.1 Uma2 family endonuclease [Clostridium butyricum]